MLEVEQKFRVDDLARLGQQILATGGKEHERQRQVDAYFAHPVRDFAKTDEALRLRRVGESNVVTYKGPKLDTETKTRREIELPLAGGAASFEMWSEMLTVLGFEPVAEVAKWRTPYELQTEARTLHVLLDEVDGLGAFVEIEMMAEQAELDQALSAIANVADQLELIDSERLSYLELLLASSK